MRVIKHRLTYHPRAFSHPLHYAATTHVLALELTNEIGTSWPSESAHMIATLYDDVWRVMIATVEGASHETVESAIQHLVSRSLSFLAKVAPAHINLAIEYLHSHWDQVPSTAALARHLNISSQHLCRSFRKYTEVTIQ